MLSNESLGLLKESKIFKGLSDDHMEMISAHGDLVNYGINDIIIEKGQTGHPLHIIMEGRVEVFLPKKRKGYTKERPTKIKLNRLSQGDCIGEYSLLDNQPASASVVAIEPCRIFKISRTEFEEIITNSEHIEKTIYKNMLKVLIKRSRQYDNELDICY